MRSIAFTLPLEIVGQMRSRHRIVTPKSGNRKPFAMVYKDSKQRSREEALIAVAKRYAPARPFTGLITLELVIGKGMPHSWSLKKQREMLNKPCDSKPDLSNIFKHVEDCLTEAGFWEDDKQIWRFSTSSKSWASGSFIAVRITEDSHENR
jgi:Holliday junction resolvase RusA-like endonuclease